MKSLCTVLVVIIITSFLSWFFVVYGGVRSVCVDGYLSQSYGPGTCSHHGGVLYDWRDAMPADSSVIKRPDH